jgi:hypothetical protein
MLNDLSGTDHPQGSKDSKRGDESRKDAEPPAATGTKTGSTAKNEARMKQAVADAKKAILHSARQIADSPPVEVKHTAKSAGSKADTSSKMVTIPKKLLDNAMKEWDAIKKHKKGTKKVQKNEKTAPITPASNPVFHSTSNRQRNDMHNKLATKADPVPESTVKLEGHVVDTLEKKVGHRLKTLKPGDFTKDSKYLKGAESSLLSAVHALRDSGKPKSPKAEGKELELTLDAMKLKRLQQHLYMLRGGKKVQGTGESDRIISPAAVKREADDAKKLWQVLKDKKLDQAQLNADVAMLGKAEGKLLEAVRKLKRASPQTHKDQDKELSLTMDLLKLKELEQRITTNSGLQPQVLQQPQPQQLAPVVSVAKWRHAERDLDRISDHLDDEGGREHRRYRRDRYDDRYDERRERPRYSQLSERGRARVPDRRFVRESEERTGRLQNDLKAIAGELTPHEYERDQRIISKQKHRIIDAVDALDANGVRGRIERARELALTTDAQRLEQLSLQLSQLHDTNSVQATALEQELAQKNAENERLRQKLQRLAGRVADRVH